MVVGEGFVNHQEHDAGEEGQGQDDQNGHLGGGQMPVSVCVPEQERRIVSMWDRVGVCVRKLQLTEVNGCSRPAVPVELRDD